MLLGAHVSISGGFVEAAKAGKYIGCEAIQIFSRSPRTLRRTKPIAPEEVQAFWDGLKKARIVGTATHGNYLINLSATAARMRKLARTAFVEELERAQILGIPYVIFHPGAHMGKGEAWGLRQITESVDWAMARADAPNVSPLLENTAGQGSTLGGTWEQLREIIEASRFTDRLGVCIDTCHALAAGYDFLSPDRYDGFMGHVEAVLGTRRVRAFHLNDSKQGIGSHADRHEHIGKGEIGIDPFRWLVNDPRFAASLGIIETAGPNRVFKKSLKLLKSLREPAAT
ncbi:MAG: deoxyribonuclease IV [Methanobacteriota archaeon]|nr:MAG: deoxyribonuclease IV [Euryarchaeota archaeon]